MREHIIKIKLFNTNSSSEKKNYLIDFQININTHTLKNLIIVLVIVLGAFMRFYNLNWDQGHLYHPDETNIAMAVSRMELPDNPNPEFFAYNGFLIYLVDFISVALSNITGDASWLNNLGKLNLISRHISAISSLLSLIVFYKILRNIFSKNLSIIGLTLMSFTTGLIQTAHYGVSESMLVFQLLLISYLSIKLYKDIYSKKLWLLLAIASGITVGTKTTGIAFLLIPLIVFISKLIEKREFKMIAYAFSYVLFSFIFFSIVSPISFIYFDDFLSVMRFEKSVVDGTIDVKYTTQFRGESLPFFVNNFFWYNTVFIVAAGFIGIFAWILNSIKTKRFYTLGILLFGLIYTVYTGIWYGKFIRYTVIVIPILIISTIYFLDFIKKNYSKNVFRTFSLILLITTILWGTSFFTVYIRENSRIQASKWIAENIPANSNLITEHWDKRLPTYISDYRIPNYNFAIMNVYNSQTTELAREFASVLSTSDYYIIGSQRGYGPLLPLEEEYKYSSSMYELLFEGELGYQEIQRITSYPKLGPIEINNLSAEETFKVFDHPTIIIYENTGKSSEEEIYKKILMNIDSTSYFQRY